MSSQWLVGSVIFIVVLLLLALLVVKVRPPSAGSEAAVQTEPFQQPDQQTVRQIGRAWLRENEDDPELEEVRWWPAAPLKDSFFREDTEGHRSIHADWRQIPADGTSIRLQYRAKANSEPREFVDRVFLIDNEGVLRKTVGSENFRLPNEPLTLWLQRLDAMPDESEELQRRFLQPENQRQAERMQNLIHLSWAMEHYMQTYRRYPPAVIRDPAGRPLLSWRVALLEFLDPLLYEQFRLNESWDSPHNLKLISKMPRFYESPPRQNDGNTVVLAPVGPGTMFEKPQGVRVADIIDGTNNTIMLVEAAAEFAVPWTAPMELPYDPQEPHARLKLAESDEGLVLMATTEGRVLMPKPSVSADLLRAMFTMAGREAIDTDAFIPLLTVTGD
jgi:hypothetical protein